MVWSRGAVLATTTLTPVGTLPSPPPLPSLPNRGSRGATADDIDVAISDRLITGARTGGNTGGPGPRGPRGRCTPATAGGPCAHSDHHNAGAKPCGQSDPTSADVDHYGAAGGAQHNAPRSGNHAGSAWQLVRG